MGKYFIGIKFPNQTFLSHRRDSVTSFSTLIFHQTVSTGPIRGSQERLGFWENFKLFNFEIHSPVLATPGSGPAGVKLRNLAKQVFQAIWQLKGQGHEI